MGMTQMKGITCCGDCGYYNWKKHKCTRATDEGDARSSFYVDCPLPDVVVVQTPQVLSLDDIHRGMVVWLEDKDKPEPILAIGGASSGGAKCFITVSDMAVSALADEYNIRWRAWTDCLSKEEMGATPWD